MSYAYLFKYIIIGDTGKRLCQPPVLMRSSDRKKYEEIKLFGFSFFSTPTPLQNNQF